MQLEFFPSRTLTLYLIKQFATRIFGVLLMLVLETEKALMRRLGWFEELGGAPSRGRQA